MTDEQKAEAIKGWAAYADAVLDEQFKLYQELAKIQEADARLSEELRQKGEQGWVAYVDAVLAEMERENAALNELLAEQVKAREEANQKMLEGEVARAEAIIQESFKEAQALADIQIEAAKKRQAVIDTDRDAFRDLFMSTGRAFTTSFQGIIQGTQSISDAFRRMGQSILLTISETIINQGIRVLADELAAIAFPGATKPQGGGAGGWLGLIAGAIGGIGGLFGGGAAVASAPVFAMQHGGVVTRPTLGFLGERGAEAVIPLDRAGLQGVTVNQTFNVTAGVPEAVRRELNAMRAVFKQDAVDAVLEARNRGGSMARAMGERAR